jgi:AraC-like DNA-binding protein
MFRVAGAALLRGEFNAPWAVESPPASAIAGMLHAGTKRLIIFHIVAAGSCWVETDRRDRRLLQQGDVVGFPHGQSHRIGSGDVDAIPFSSLMPPPPWTELPVVRHGRSGERTHIVCVYLTCDSLLFQPFLAALPNLLIVPRDRGMSGPWFEANLRYLVEEAVRARPGTACMMARMTELLFIEALRIHMAGLQQEDTGWLAGLNDRYTGRALTMFHRRPAEPWTIALLAREVGLSRSALARHFQRLLKISPIQYLMIWRLHLAAQALLDGRETIAAVAARVGYQSEEGFSRAFKRCFGSSPAEWRESRSPP